MNKIINTINKENNAQNYLDGYLNKNYPQLERNQITELDLSGWIEESWTAKNDWNKLTGILDLSDFPNLEKLNCSYNEITALNLENCLELTELKCWGNNLTEIRFPSHLKLKTFQAWTNNLTEIDWSSFDSESLTYISISNNNLSDQDIEVITRFTNLTELYLGTDDIKRLGEGKYNSFNGTLKFILEKCSKLIRLQIEGTGIENDLKKIPKDLKIISWHKQNDTIARIIPLERLHIIRSNINQFIKKWGKEVDYNWYQFKGKGAKKETVLSELRNPNDFTKQWYLIKFIQWANRATSVIGGSLLLVGTNESNDELTKIGGIIAITAPFFETLTSFLDDKFYQVKQIQWDEFLSDSETFLNNYNELIGIINQFAKSSKLKGSVNEGIENLREKIEELLEIYDGVCDDELDGEIDINELTTRREKLFADINKGKDGTIQGIVDDIKNLEKSIIEYRKLSYYESTSYNKKDEDNKRNSQTSQLIIKSESEIELISNNSIKEEIQHEHYYVNVNEKY